MASVSYQLAYSELAGLWIEAGGNPQHAAVAAAVAWAESKGCQYAKAGPTNDQPLKVCTYRYTTGEDSYGFWQINRDAHPSYTVADLYSQVGNARAAKAISSDGANWNPWTQYTNGAYRQYLQTDFVPTIPGPGGGTTTGALSGTATGTHQFEQAWSGFMRTLAVTAPLRLRQVRANRARIRKAVGL